MTPRLRLAAPIAVAGLVLVACGGGSDDTDSGDTAAPTDDTAVQDDQSDGSEAGEDEPTNTSASDAGGGGGAADDADDAGDTADTADDASAPSGGFEPGPIRYRAINLLDAPVDLYARTTGLVEAFPIQMGLAPGEISDFVSPPEGGVFLVTEAGASDPTCVGSCEQFIAELSGFPDEGPTRTVVLYGDDFDPTQAFELWEEPTATAPASANRMPDADPAAALAVITAAAVTNNDFGLRVGTPDSDVCLSTIDDANVLVGGTQTPAYAFGEAGATFTLHDNTDQDCSADPVGGPVEITGGPGSRTHVVLSGEPGALEVIVLAMEGSVDPAPAGDGGASAGGPDDATALATELMTDEVVNEFGLDDASAACVAELIVAAIGPDTLLDGDRLVDLDSLPDETNQLAGEALFESVDACGIDPAVFGA